MRFNHAIANRANESRFRRPDCARTLLFSRILYHHATVIVTPTNQNCSSLLASLVVNPSQLLALSFSSVRRSRAKCQPDHCSRYTYLSTACRMQRTTPTPRDSSSIGSRFVPSVLARLIRVLDFTPTETPFVPAMAKCSNQTRQPLIRGFGNRRRGLPFIFLPYLGHMVGEFCDNIDVSTGGNPRF